MEFDIEFELRFGFMKIAVYTLESFICSDCGAFLNLCTVENYFSNIPT